ncbi:MAG: CsbD family protein [Planctomycetaceae bacterium]|nr:CsbD family protein [Planctomycetaceae bacterium]
MLNQQVLEGNWNQLKGKIRQRWGQLSDSDVAHFRGNVDELIGTIQQKTGEGRNAIESYLQELTGSAGTVMGQAAETARQYAHQATEQYYEGMEGVRSFVRDRPGQALAIGFGTGMLVGLIVALSCRK